MGDDNIEILYVPKAPAHIERTIDSSLALLSVAPYKIPTLVEDETLNDSNKSFTVTANHNWEILNIHVELTTTATAGDRQMALVITSAGGVRIFRLIFGVVQAASLGRFYDAAPGLPLDTAFTVDQAFAPLPIGLWVPSGAVVNVVEANAVDAAADDMLVRMVVNEVSS